MRKSFPKILTIFFLTVFILQIICLFFLLTVPVASQAANPIQFTPQVQGLNYTFNSDDKSTGNIANLVKAVYNYAIGIVGILAAVILMYGGVRWIVAGGNATQVGEAKAWIGAALTGLLLALTSYLILSTINPALVNLQTTGIQSVAEYTNGSCTTIEGQVCTDNMTEENCLKTYAVFKKGEKCPTPCCAFNESPRGTTACASCGRLFLDCIDNQQSLTETDCIIKKTSGNTLDYHPSESGYYCFKYSSITITPFDTRPRYECLKK